MPSFTGTSGRRWAYDTGRRLGSPGGFGEVFLGTDGRHDIAVKRIPLRIGDSRELRRRDREVEIAKKLTSGRAPFQHVLVPIDWGTMGEDLLIVMPRAEHSLADATYGNKLSLEERYHAIREVAQGLAELSSVGVLHRDLKPANVLRFQGTWHLSDFGISRDIDAPTATYTFSGVGTFPYMAPEVWDLRPATTKTDLYALGVLAYEVISGRRPFLGPNAEDFERQHIQEMPPPLDINDGRMSRLVTRLLSKDPASRPQDARAVVEVIDSAMHRLDSAREQVAASAAAMASALSKQEADRSKQARRAELRTQALGELSAFLEDVTDDMRDVFPGARFTKGDDYNRLHLDPADLFVRPIDQGRERYPASAIVACSVHAALPGKVEDARPGRMLSQSFGALCTASLLCDLVGNRLEWSIATFWIADWFPNGDSGSNVFAMRAEAKHYGAVTKCKSRPFDADGMMWLIQHSFESLSRYERFGNDYLSRRR